MPGRAPRVLVVGAGIGGLSSAIALRRSGIEVEIAEASDPVRTVGAGVTLQPNATAILAALGVELRADDVHAIGDVAMLDSHGRQLMGGAFSNSGGPSGVNIRRGDLHRTLLEENRDTPLRAGSPVEIVEDTASECVVRFGDGRESTFDVVVGADGVHSKVRASVLPSSQCKLRFAGQTCWRFMVEDPSLHPAITIERWSPGTRTGVVPLSRHGIYVYLVASANRGEIDRSSSDPAWLREHMGHVDERIPALLHALETSAEPRIHHADLCDQPNLSFGRGRVVLIGDAAHALTPNMGQGAAMAIEDAAALALIVRQTPATGWAAALDSKRRQRVEQIAKTSWRIGQMAHWRGSFARFARDVLLRATPSRSTHRMVRRSWQPGIELATALRAS